jgi:hypothetical protein
VLKAEEVVVLHQFGGNKRCRKVEEKRLLENLDIDGTMQLKRVQISRMEGRG